MTQNKKDECWWKKLEDSFDSITDCCLFFKPDKKEKD